MTTEPIITYQLNIQGGSDVILRLLPSDTSITDPARRVKDVLDLVVDRVDVRVYEEDPTTGQSQERRLTDDETTELETALEQVLGREVAVHPSEDL